MEWVIVLMLLGIIPAYVAMAKGRNFMVWWLYGTFLFVFAIFHAIVIRPVDENLHHYGRRYCPHCEKIIDLDATRCEFCEAEVPPVKKE
ncbi:zinc ribbon domain-containing protein [Geoalkalibacter halelectricus]|uniref:zinc ribbon domain-containing protein n=1 Tax=Geoalkalibacter halelectricus TaxID=2847045 RepID=UPI003D20765B